MPGLFNADVEQLAVSVPPRFGEWTAMPDATSRAELSNVPEICYPVQGHKVLKVAPAALPVPADGSTLPGKHILAGGEGLLGVVTNWTRISGAYPKGGLAMRVKILCNGLQGRVSDGILVRSSMTVRGRADAANACVVREEFQRQLLAASGARGKTVIARTLQVRP